MKLNEETLTKLCAALVVTPKWTHVCRHVGISRETLNVWMAKSRAGDEQFKFFWDGDGVDAPLHVHMEAARQLNILALKWRSKAGQRHFIFRAYQCGKLIH